ncbi:hypothetical protein HAX54_013652 [Datura stramonium]|uniref:Uncharacterized protein n=1 Tax=Datura stramonium TaxID=4076 RepID=A0ABS8TMJ6_DATST|nr:hypothetical protein [Datura stramonium]
MTANSSKCIQDQKMLLLLLKNNLTCDSELSPSPAKWDETIDCINPLANLKFLSVIHLDGNNLSAPLPEFFADFTNLTVLSLRSCSLIGQVPHKIFQVPTLHTIDSSDNFKLEGTLPEFPSNGSLQRLFLSYTEFSGSLPESIGNLRMLSHVSFYGCNFTATQSLASFTLIQQFQWQFTKLKMLVNLDLSHNRLSVDTDISESDIALLPKLSVLSIDCSGVNYTWPALQIIDLASNNFSGILPRILFLELEAMKVESAHSRADHLYAANRISFGDDSRAQVDIYYQDTVTITLKGQEMSVPKIWLTLNSIDFSNNSFVGGIPKTVGELKLLYLLNLSHNTLTGKIPPAIGNLKELGSLDLSSNKLNGHIPENLSGIPHLSFLNLSYNELVGMIPRGNQVQTFDNKSFMGNKGLCGFPMDKVCNNDREEVPLQPAASEDEQFFSGTDIYAGAALGFAVGMAIIFLPLLVSRGWRGCYNKLVNGLTLWIFSKVDVKKRRTNTSIAEIYWKKKARKSHRQVPNFHR